MKIVKFAEYLSKIEKTDSRNETTEILAKMFSLLETQEIDKACYLLLGRLGPLYEKIEFGISIKTMIKVIGRAFDLEESEVSGKYKEVGDLGDVVEHFSMQKNTEVGNKLELTVVEVFTKLHQVAEEAGEGSQDRKIESMADLIYKISPLSAKYITRIPLNKLRLGFSDMTILDALSFYIYGDKSARKDIEKRYNVATDIGLVAKIIKKEGLEGLDLLTITPGIPIRPAAAERLPTVEKIMDKMGGKVLVEPKLDGFRLQCHLHTDNEGNKKVDLFSRNLDRMTDMFPDIVKSIKNLPVDNIIFEGEAIAYDTNSGELLTFQETIKRRRKYDIKNKAEEIPLRVYVFDLLYCEDETYLSKILLKRKERLADVFSGRQDLLLEIDFSLFDSPHELREYFQDQINTGKEGILTKKVDGIYTPGKRNYNWVKLKREEGSQIDDTIDCVILGYQFGTGKRVSFGIGAFLVGVYNEQKDNFQSISKVGTGLTDEKWVLLREKLDQFKVKQKPPQYEVDNELTQDVWVNPEIVVEIRADEITLSPAHRAGVVEENDSGYALRFPRLIKMRPDKGPSDITTVDEIRSLYAQQGA